MRVDYSASLMEKNNREITCGFSFNLDFGDKASDTSTRTISYATIPESIRTPDKVETRLGTLEFSDVYPSAETVEAVYDNLDFQRGVRVFPDALPIASLYAMRAGVRQAGLVDGTVGIFEELMHSKTLFLTANTESIYAMTWLDPRYVVSDYQQPKWRATGER